MFEFLQCWFLERHPWNKNGTLKFVSPLHLYDSGSDVISSALPACPARFHGLLKKGKYGRFSSGKSNCMPLCFEKAKTSVTIEGRNKVIPCTVLTYIKAATIRPAACFSGLYNIRPGSEAVLHMSRIEFEFRPTQINLDRLNWFRRRS